MCYRVTTEWSLKSAPVFYQLLVLGRPGSGCSTFLRAVANEHKGFLDVQGELLYNGIDFKTVAKKYSQECIYNGEDDVVSDFDAHRK